MIGMPVMVCPHCKTGADFSIAASTRLIGPDEIIAGVLLCPLCKKHVFCVLKNGAIIQSHPRGGVRSPASELPPPVRQPFQEAIDAQSAGAPNASMCMSRRAIQEALVGLGAKKGDLPTQLDDLVSRGIVTKDLREWADHARIGGRIAAHGTGGKDWGNPENNWGSRDDAEAVLTFCEAFFEYVYVLPEKNRQRRANTLEARSKT